jgi:hypothetical protein
MILTPPQRGACDDECGGAAFMKADAGRHAGGQLIEGGIGPFYVAVNRAAFFLVAGVFIAVIPLVVYLIRDASTPIVFAVVAGIALEAGAVAHIMVERVLTFTARAAWLSHAAVSVAMASALVLFLFG